MPREDITHHELTDEDITRMVVEALAWNPNARFQHVRVDVDEGIVRLSGQVDCISEKTAAEESASHIPEVTQVINDIEVMPPIAEDDSSVEADLKNMLSQDPRLDGRYFEVTVRNGTADVKGEVITETEKLAALDIARATYGVREVVDHIIILPEQSSNDHMLEDLVTDTLLRTGNIDGKNIQAHVRANTVYLYGKTLAERQKAEIQDVVSTIPGVEQVVNNLTVEEL